MVVVLVDFNVDTTSQELNQFFCKLDLVNMVTGLHKGKTPLTYNCGSKPINGIFMPAHLLPHCHGRYLEFGKGVPSDHQVVWLDLPANLVCS